MVDPRFLDIFWEYLIWYPGKDEEGYDGVHDGGRKGIRDDAPEEAKKAYAEFVKMKKEAEKRLEKI